MSRVGHLMPPPTLLRYPKYLNSDVFILLSFCSITPSGALHGAIAAGCLATSFTCSQVGAAGLGRGIVC